MNKNEIIKLVDAVLKEKIHDKNQQLKCINLENEKRIKEIDNRIKILTNTIGKLSNPVLI